jgi:hypothetical protein
VIPLPPALTFAWRYRRWVAYGLAVVAVAALLWRVNVWHDKAGKLDAAVKALATEEAAHKATVAAQVAENARSQAEREALAADLAGIRAKFAGIVIPTPKTLVRIVEVPRGTSETCPSPRVSPDFVRVWNDAGTP